MNAPLAETLASPNNMLLAPFSFLAPTAGTPAGAWIDGTSGGAWRNEAGNYILSF